jgi:branched-chain amino acid transport system permease protein
MIRRSIGLPILICALALVTVQVLTRVIDREFYLTQLTMTAYYTVVVLGLCLVMGYAGQISLGHGAFFALGGYTTAILTTRDLTAVQGSLWVRALGLLGALTERADAYGAERLVVASGAALLLGMLLTAAVALLIGYPALRLKGHYLAMATLGFGLIIYRLVLGSAITGAADGIHGVPPLDLAICSVSHRAAFRVANYYLAWGFVLLVLTLLLNIVRSRAGRALRAIHDGELAANAMGVHTASIKLQVFVLSAVLSAAAGALMTHYSGGIGPSEAGAMKSVRYVALVAAGGMAHLWGALMVSSVLNLLSLRGVFGSLDEGVFGAILILIVALAPDGPGRALGDRWRRMRRPRMRRDLPSSADSGGEPCPS